MTLRILHTLTKTAHLARQMSSKAFKPKLQKQTIESTAQKIYSNIFNDKTSTFVMTGLVSVVGFLLIREFEKIDEANKMTNGRIDAVNSRIDDTAKTINARIDDTAKTINVRIDHLGDKVDQLKEVILQQRKSSSWW